MALAGMAALAALAVGPGAGPAAAHDELTGTEPADGATVDVAPDRVVLTFTEPALELGTEVLVTGPDGAVVSEGPATLDGPTVSQALSVTRPAGAYRVDWRVTSEDGHPVSGSFGFTATAATAREPSAAPSPTPTAAPSTAPPSTAAAAPATDEPTADPSAASLAPDTAAPGRSATRDGWIAAAVVVLVAGVLALATAGRRASLRRKPAED